MSRNILAVCVSAVGKASMTLSQNGLIKEHNTHFKIPQFFFGGEGGVGKELSKVKLRGKFRVYTI